MRLPVIFASTVIAALVAILLGLFAGFGAGQIVLFTLAVVALVEFAYVGLVAAMAMRVRRKNPEARDRHAPRESAPMTRRHDT